eukprot:TRINITY_DN8389_c0_g1_i1.p1 TRINITY_DN8389_c0_g1~~TRINITY_DN8389_c0_g1_i1.p1  ORF type:complete len:208 (+),score=34.19 TRINITY_DN8389_c0_g1_i1:110-733(+)
MSWVSLELQDDDSQPIVAPADPPGKKNDKIVPPARAGSVEQLDDYAGFPEDAVIRKGRDSQQNDVVSRSKRKMEPEKEPRGRLKDVSKLKGVKIEADSLLSDLNEPEDIDSVPEPVPKRHKVNPDPLHSVLAESPPLVTFNDNAEKDIFDEDRTQMESTTKKETLAENSEVVVTQPLSHPAGSEEIKKPSLILHYDTDDGEDDSTHD